MSQAYAALREEAGHGETDAFVPSEFPHGRRYDRVVAISRSGTTTEVLRFLVATDLPTVAITAVPGSPIAEAAGDAILIPFADERSVVQTRSATSALALLRAGLGADLGPAAADAERALAAPLPGDAARHDHFVFLGHGWSVGLANEAALKLRETSLTPAESYPAMEYRHGPMSLAGERTLVWILGTSDPAIADDVRATGATVREGTFDPMAEIVLVHRLALALAAARGVDPDNPRHLSRSIVLPG